MIDLHCHILPGVDDGPETIEESLEQAREHVRLGVRTVAATSHVSYEYPTDQQLATDLTANLREQLEGAGIALEVIRGAEIAPTELDRFTEDDLAAMTLGGGDCLLVECPFSTATGILESSVKRLQSLGFKVLLAHPERCPGFVSDPRSLEPLVAAGAMVQVTAASLSGTFGQTVRKAAMHFAREGMIDIVASDAHDPHHRAPGLADHLEAAGLEAMADHWCLAAPAAILSGDPLPPPPAVNLAAPHRQGRFGWMSRLRG